MTQPVFEELQAGDTVATETIAVTRDSLVRYAGASGDFNPIHYRDDVATSVGLPGVLAHGMLTMGVAMSVVTNWLAGAGEICDAQARFTRPVVVPADSAAEVTVAAKITSLDAESRTAQLTLQTVHADKTVLAKALVAVKFQ